MENKTLKIDEHYSIEMNTNEYLLKYEEKYIHKDGKEKTTRDNWSYPRLAMALKKYLDQSQKQGTFQEILEATKRAEEKINKIAEQCKTSR